MNTTTTEAVATITSSILEMTSLKNTSFLNWDGVTSQEDFFENIKEYVSRVTGWKLLNVEIEGTVLTIRRNHEIHGIDTLLSYNIKSGHEIYGRLRHVGFTWERVKELDQWLNSNSH